MDHASADLKCMIYFVPMSYQSSAPVTIPRTLWATERTLRQLLESTPLAIVATDQQGAIIYVNSELEEMFGYGRSELIGQPVEVLIPERFHPDHRDHRSEYVHRPHVRPMGSGLDLSARRKDGSEFPIEAGLSYIDAEGQTIMFALITDISRRKHTEEILERRVEERTREIERRQRVSDTLRDILALLNSDRPLQEILDHIVLQASRMLGAAASAIYRLQSDNDPITLLATYNLPSTFLTGSRVALESGRFGGLLNNDPQAANQAADGNTPDAADVIDIDELYGAQLAVPLALKDEIYGGLMLYYRDPRIFTPEEIELAVTFGEQAKLAIENARLRAQSEQLAVTAERNRIARDLHDSVTQTLFSASLIAEVLPRIAERDPAETKRRLEELRQLTRGALAEMRTLLLELRPATLIEVDLSELLRQLAEVAIGRARIPVKLTIEGNSALPPDVKIAFYHIAQESLNNVTRHARASSASISLERQPGKVQMRVCDNGRGFDLGKVPAEHLGLAIMRERADGIQAQLILKSELGKGTEITVLWSSQPTQLA